MSLKKLVLIFISVYGAAEGDGTRSLTDVLIDTIELQVLYKMIQKKMWNNLP
jgi:hypothetical protein